MHGGKSGITTRPFASQVGEFHCQDYEQMIGPTAVM